MNFLTLLWLQNAYHEDRSNHRERARVENKIWKGDMKVWDGGREEKQEVMLWPPLLLMFLFLEWKIFEPRLKPKTGKFRMVYKDLFSDSFYFSEISVEAHIDFLTTLKSWLSSIRKQKSIKKKSEWNITLFMELKVILIRYSMNHIHTF